ncbi:MAG: rod shape-determining protein RodA [Pseudomonadota bacterium]|nr:rod shape-determining protein RodA [Pseudomonadota bacterium]
MQITRNYTTIDFILLFMVLGYTTFGLLLLASAAEGNVMMIVKQSFHVALAIIIAVVINTYSNLQIQRYAFFLYFFAVMLLVTVLVFGHVGKGAQRWLDLKFVRFEPSEIMKIVLPLTLASYIQQHELPLRNSIFLQCVGLILLPFYLIAKQPDLGTALITAIIGFFTLFMAGLPIQILSRIIYGLVFTSPITWHLLHPYQQQRILTLLSPKADVAGAGYHIEQAKIAIGAGGVLGKGWFQGTQSHLQFLPEHNTDFIFALCAEEFGFLGCLFLITLCLGIISRCFILSSSSQDSFTRLATAGITFSFGLCSCINIAMVSALIPVVGIPLPLISYGGTTMVMSMVGFGVIHACSRNTKLFTS